MTVSSTTDGVHTNVFDYTKKSEKSNSADDKLGRDAFLGMLITQLQYQDPLNPMESTDFSSQLAEFSSLEQMFQLNETLTDIQSTIEQETDEASQNVMDYIGKGVTTDNSSLKVSDGDADTVYFELEKDAEAYVTIYDSSGAIVNTLYLDDLEEGTNSFKWNCADREDEEVEDGTYYIDIKAFDTDGKSVTASLTSSGTVTSVVYKGDTPYLVLDDEIVVKPGSVTAVYEPEKTDDTDDDTDDETDDETENDGDDVKESNA